MDPHLFPTSFLIFLFMIFILIRVPRSVCANDDRFTTCGDQLFGCGKISKIGYPFWGMNRPGYCGHPGFNLSCQGDVTSLKILSTTFRVLEINSTVQKLTVARDDLWNNICPTNFVNATLDWSLFSYSSDIANLTLLYGCPSIPVQVPVPRQFSCPANSNNNNSYYEPFSGTGTIPGLTCSNEVIVQVSQSAATTALDLTSTTSPSKRLEAALEGGFGLSWQANDAVCSQCVKSGGRCGYNDSNLFTCYCSDQPYTLQCNGIPSGTGSSGKKSENVTLPIGLAIGGTVFICVGLVWFFLSWRQKKKQRLAAASLQTKSKDLEAPPSSKGLTTTPSTNFSQSIPSYPSSKSDLENASTYFGAQVFTYAELEEATENFDASRELGDGGFGTVYYGKLKDGRIVAVKRLYENNFKRVEQFVNEVRILTTLRHENLVTLHGCTSKRSRELLLVYEYISNGTVADHLHGKRSNSGLLSWPVRLNIAIETAEALAYLHASDVIHRDVKTNNILLENDFHVKVADFGLSRLFPNDVTHVSTAPQGTPGYVDPEYYQCYQLTEKSDVYSFGVVLVELISSKQAVDTNRHRHDINLANMAVNKIQNHTLHELVDPSIGFETDSTVRRMATLVAQLAFRCLQQEKDMRPSMGEVLEALKGIKNEEYNAEKAEIVDIVDIMEDDVGLLKANPPPFSPDSHKWVSSSTTPNSSG
ncbi:LEAF RUST 10 DISEASE-RESISTANCE LOCUS RECEPTOR-LIKE PROTEIN KINASE-like 1.4 isoform X3 [Cornus florida]|uniref:LEAF RUST 10 DISEASE-RESISTANCE LOCUS RECEPTOR-LIKE PROTEIN KINASE-like 1.4 isoform X3 n=1 Tax=Cornus florida TaxID=4283 RepID=UPI0028A1CDED|nr:LEAF RUST 10 DISEASE-RESISTANCE LOCUS RECEPTOR-LIKE PROTEIN KINASE-like 1.4 isoform X3 [Cornus florida]